MGILQGLDLEYCRQLYSAHAPTSVSRLDGPGLEVRHRSGPSWLLYIFHFTLPGCFQLTLIILSLLILIKIYLTLLNCPITKSLDLDV